MSENIRDRFRGTKVSAQKKAKEEAKKRSEKGKKKYEHNINPGNNIFRIAPPHEPDSLPGQNFEFAYLKMELPKKDDKGNDTDELEVRNKLVFVAKTHQKLNPDGSVPKCIQETYRKYIYARAYDEFQDEKERSEFLEPYTGTPWEKRDYNKANKKEIHNGIRPQLKVVYYAWNDSGELNELRLAPYASDRMEEILAEQEAAGEMMDVDIFSDVDRGRLLQIKKIKGEKLQLDIFNPDPEWFENNYGVSEEEGYKMYKDAKNGIPLTDKQLQELSKLPSLKSRFYNVYSKNDFDLAVTGLRYFDEQHGYGIFENEEFLEEMKEIEALVPEKVKTEEEKSKDGDDIDETFNKKSPEAKVDYSKWPKPKCKKHLEQYILDAYGGDETLPELDLSTMREWCAIADQGEELPFDSVQQEGDKEQEKETPPHDLPWEESEESAPKEDLNDKLSALRKRAGK